MREIIKGLKLIKYGLNVKLNICFMILFFVIGMVLEIGMTYASSRFVSWDGGIDTGGIFLVLTGMYPLQLLLSLNVGDYVHSSGYKKRIEVSIPAKLECAGSVLMLTVIVIIRVVAAAIQPSSSIYQMQAVLYMALYTAVIMIFLAFYYKYLLASLIVLYVGLFGFGFYDTEGFSGMMLPVVEVLVSRPVLCVLISYLIVFAASALFYLIMRALYRKPYSKWAFRSALQRNL